jgi:hypothetical protein
MTRKVLSVFRPADLVNLCFLFFLAALTIIFHRKIDAVGSLVSLYCLLFVLQIFLVRFRKKDGAMRWVYDLIFPTLSIVLVFDSLGRIVHAVNPRDIDPFLIRLDYAILGFYPTVAIERWVNPYLTDILQVAYSSYYFLPLTLGVMLKIERKDEELGHSPIFSMSI